MTASPPAVGADRPLTRETVIAAALEVVDRDGLEGLSLRKVAALLGVGTMSLYTHVVGKSDLLDGLIACAVAEVVPGDPADAWQERVRRLCSGVFSTFDRHPNLVPLVLTRPMASRPQFDVAEAGLAAFGDAGLDGHRALLAHRLLWSTLGGILTVEQSTIDGPVLPKGTDLVSFADGYPHLFAALPDMSTLPGDEVRSFAVETVIRGIESLASGPGAGRAND